MECRPGESILSHARSQGIYIPTLCFIKQLSPHGACRLCIVEDLKTGKLAASCVTPAAPGMSINTCSEKVIKTRRNVLRLILASHPEACTVCDKGNRCELREKAAELGVGLIDLDRIATAPGPVDINPYLERDMAKCIMCGRCMRACHELVVEGVVDYFDRGFDARPATALNLPLADSNCTFCGTCIALCPTGALKEKGRISRGTVSPLTPSVCPYCGCGCATNLEIKQDKIVGIANGVTDPDFNPAICARGRYGFDFIDHKKRLKSPLIRKDGELVECDWDEALDFAAGGLDAIREDHSPNALAVLGSGKCTVEENYLLQKFARQSLGTNNIDHLLRGVMVQKCDPQGDPLLMGRCCSPLPTLEDCDAILVVGADPTLEAPVTGYAIKRAVRMNDARLVLIESGVSGLGRHSSVTLQILPAMEGLAIAGMAIEMAEDDLRRMGKSVEVSYATHIFQRLSSDFSMEKVVEFSGLAKTEIAQAAEFLIEARSVGIVYGPQLIDDTCDSKNMRALGLLADALEMLADVEVRFYIAGVECNTRGASDMGVLPFCLPGYADITDTESLTAFSKAWEVDLPTKAGHPFVKMMEEAMAGNLKGMLLAAANPPAEVSPSDLSVQALQSLDFMVVLDLFESELTDLADVVLPGRAFAEKEGVFTAADGTVHSLSRAVPPPEGTRSESWIIGELSKRLGRVMAVETREVRAEIGRLVPAYAQIVEEKSSFEVGDRGSWDSRESKINLEEFKQSTNGSDFPFPLTAHPDLTDFAGGTRIKHTRRLKGMTSLHLEMNAMDARQAQLLEGDMAKLSTQAKELKIPVRLNHRVRPGTLVLSGTGALSILAGLSAVDEGQMLNNLMGRSCNADVSKI